MADYTCHNGKNPRSKYFHSGNTSFLSQIAPDRSGNDNIISCIPKISRKAALTPPSRRGGQSHADDSKDLCVCLDDRHGFAAAVLTKYSCMQRPRGVKQHLWVFVSLQVLISVRKCVWFSRDMYSILIKRRKGLCCNILFKLFIFAICISVCYSKKEWFRIQTKIRGNDI